MFGFNVIILNPNLATGNGIFQKMFALCSLEIIEDIKSLQFLISEEISGIPKSVGIVWHESIYIYSNLLNQFGQSTVLRYFFA
jgi:hypothetical protein